MKSTLLPMSLFVMSCAFDITDVKYSPAALFGQSDSMSSFVLDDDLRITQTPCWYSRTLNKNTRWDFIGKIQQGNVYKSRDQTLTVECSNIFEAYLVVTESRLVGFYLPVESGFVGISDPILLPQTKKE